MLRKDMKIDYLRERIKGRKKWRRYVKRRKGINKVEENWN